MLGLKKEIKKIIFSESEKRKIIEDYLQSGLSKQEIWNKYTNRDREHGQLLRWMHQYGYMKNMNTFVEKKQMSPVSKKEQSSEQEFEMLQLQKRILDLEKQLRESEMKSIAWQTMVEIAERELNISIKKKYNTKPSKK